MRSRGTNHSPTGHITCLERRSSALRSEIAELNMPNGLSKAVFFGYTLIAELDPLPNENGERFWRARVVDHRGVRMNFPRAAGWVSQAEAEEHAENIARCSALRRGIVLSDYKPRWTLI